MDPWSTAIMPPREGSVDDEEEEEVPWEYSLRKYLLLLATLVATVTYTAGFTPPGGVWQETDPTAGGYLAGDPIIRYTSKLRYVAFFYSNATAFASSLVVIVLILILSVRHELASANILGPLSVLRGFMLLDLVSLIGAYTAGTYRDRNVPVYTLVLAGLTVAYVVAFHMVLARRRRGPRDVHMVRKEGEKPRKVLMLLATFAVSVTYLAGLSAPGGFWDKADGDGHRPGDPVLMGGRHEARLKVFVRLNSTAFFSSLLIAVQLLDKHLRTHTEADARSFRFRLLYASIIVALLGLVSAYATGSSRETDTTIYVTLLVGAVPASILLFQVIRRRRENKTAAAAPPPPPATPPTVSEEANKQAQSLVLLLATLAATITYQAGLDPPGGLWENDGVGYKAGDPILLTTSPKRFKAFFYANSVAFVASLLAIILVKKKKLLQTQALQAAMILDLFGLIGAYAAGSSRDVSTSIYATALAGAVLVYVVIHVLFFTLDQSTTANDENALEVVEKRRKRLLLFAILAATITYQAGLTPPGGFRTQDDESGKNRAGDPVLHYHSPPRYNAFFYCNSVSFMQSIAMIILLVNPNLYKPAIQSHAISVCTAVGMLSLVGAYAAGSTQHMRTSLKIFGLAAAILIIVVAVVLIFVIRSKGGDANNLKRGKSKGTSNDDEKKKHSNKKYLMLLGILGASVTYQVGLKPPGGMWQGNQGGHAAGNPVMHDNGRTRYLAFFYINSTSFVASIIVIILLLLSMHKGKLRSLKAMNTTIMLDLLGLLVAYAVGSTRSWKITGYVFVLVFIVLAYIAIHVILALLIRSKGEEKVATTAPDHSHPTEVNSVIGL